MGKGGCLDKVTNLQMDKQGLLVTISSIIITIIIIIIIIIRCYNLMISGCNTMMES